MAGAGSWVWWTCRDASRPPYSASMSWLSSKVESHGMILLRVMGSAWRGAVDLFKMAWSAGVGGITIPHEQPLDSAAEVRICRSRLRRVESSWYIEMSRGRGMSVTTKGHTGSCSMVREIPPEVCCPRGPKVLKPGRLKPDAESWCMGFAMLREYACLVTRQGVVSMLTYYPRIVSFEKLGEN